MKHIFLITTLFLCTTYSSHTMEITPKKIDPPSSFSTQMCLHGIESGSPLQVKTALWTGADVNYTNSDGKSLFYLACEKKNNKDLLEGLITHENINLNAPNSKGLTPIHAACKLGLTLTVKSMLRKTPQGALFSNENKTLPLHSASLFGNKDCIELLLTHDISIINYQNCQGETALHIACNRQQFDAIELLVKKGANPIIKNDYQATPFVVLFSNIIGLENAHNLLANLSEITLYQLVQTTDEWNNNQLHLCTTLSSINNAKFELYLSFLAKRLNIHSRNKDGKRAVDLACEAYEKYNNEFYKQYIVIKMKFPLIVAKPLTNPERRMHAFLRLISPHTQCEAFKHILEQQIADGLQLPEDVKKQIAYLYYAINIETIIAKKYKNNDTYSNDFIENKNKVRQQLLANPEPKLLWSA